MVETVFLFVNQSGRTVPEISVALLKDIMITALKPQMYVFDIFRLYLQTAAFKKLNILAESFLKARLRALLLRTFTRQRLLILK